MALEAVAQTESHSEVWYRYEHSGSMVYITSYPVAKHTPKGVWLELYGFRRFVLRDARKRYACPTPEEALYSFKRRKEAHIRHLNVKLVAAQQALENALNGRLNQHASGIVEFEFAS